MSDMSDKTPDQITAEWRAKNGFMNPKQINEYYRRPRPFTTNIPRPTRPPPRPPGVAAPSVASSPAYVASSPAYVASSPASVSTPPRFNLADALSGVELRKTEVDAKKNFKPTGGVALPAFNPAAARSGLRSRTPTTSDADTPQRQLFPTLRKTDFGRDLTKGGRRKKRRTRKRKRTLLKR